MRKYLFKIIMVALVLGYVGLAFAQEQEPAVAQKVYLVYSGDSNSSYFLESLETVDFNGIKCLKGKHAEISWMKSTVVYIPVDKVIGITEYNSLQQYKEAHKEFYNKRNVAE